MYEKKLPLTIGPTFRNNPFYSVPEEVKLPNQTQRIHYVILMKTNSAFIY